LQEWAEIMYEHQVTGDILHDLTGEDLFQMGIEAMGVRKKILQMVTSLRRQAGGNRNSLMSIESFDSSLTYETESSPMDVPQINSNNNANPLTSANVNLATLQQQIISNPSIINDQNFMQQFLKIYSVSQIMINAGQQVNTNINTDANNTNVNANTNNTNINADTNNKEKTNENVVKKEESDSSLGASNIKYEKLKQEAYNVANALEDKMEDKNDKNNKNEKKGKK